MTDQPDHLDLTDGEVLGCTLSDETLEAAAGTERGNVTYPIRTKLPCYYDC